MGANYIPLAELEEALGKENAEKFCRAFGGVDWRIPIAPIPDHMFSYVLDEEAFQKLTIAFGGEMIRTPNGRRKAHKEEIIELILQGKSNRQIALALGVGQAYVESLSRIYRK